MNEEKQEQAQEQEEQPIERQLRAIARLAGKPPLIEEERLDLVRDAPW